MGGREVLHAVTYWGILYVSLFIKLLLAMVFVLEFEWKRKWGPVLGGFVVFIGTVVVVTQLGDDWSRLISSIVTCTIIIVIAKSIEGKWKWIWAFVVYIILALIEGFIGTFFFAVFRIDVEKLSQPGIIGIMGNSSSLVVVLLIIALKKILRFKMSIIIKNIKIRYLYMAIAGCIACAMYVTPIQIFGLAEKSSYYQKLFAAGFSLSGVAFITAWVFIIILNDSKRVIKFELDANQVMIQQQEAYYIALLEKEVETRRFRHDVNGHLLCMHHMLKDEKIMELNRYLLDLLTDVQVLKSGVKTGNDIINCVINDILSKNDSERFDFKWNGLFPEESKIAPIDLCTIFSNLLNNAIEAVLKIEDTDKPFIRINIKNHNESLVISMENSTAHRVEIKNNQLTTTKKDKNQHGFGSQNVQKSVAKYGGEIAYRSDENIFSVEITLRDVLEPLAIQSIY